MRVPSTDGVELAVHDLSDEGGTGSPLLIAHATGFHGPLYQPLANELGESLHCVAFDFRGHGDTPLPAGQPPSTIDWERYGDDAFAMAAWLAERVGAPIDTFGHSMGGACLLMAAQRSPELFRRIIVFEPIVFPPVEVMEYDTESAMVASAKRRRASFPSFEEAIANFSRKPPLNAFTSEAMDAYVRHGFALGPDGAVHLKCLPETEAATFAAGGSHRTWDYLPDLATDVLVISGNADEMPPSEIAQHIAERLPNGRYLQRNDMDHFGPMTHPAECAEIIRTELSR